MAQTYTPVGWKDSPSTDTPINSTNLKHMDDAIKDLYEGAATTNEIIISDTQPTSEDNKLWIDTGEIGSAVSEITNSYSTSTGLGYSANYTNNLIEQKVYGEVAWENEDPSQSFAEQNITLNDTYKKIEIICGRSTTSLNNIITTVYNDNAITEMIGIVDNKLILRQCKLNGTTLEIYSGVIYSSYNSPNANDNYMIPKKIIGYK